MVQSKHGVQNVIAVMQDFCKCVRECEGGKESEQAHCVILVSLEPGLEHSPFWLS